MSEADAKKVGIEDNDWVECFNANGALDRPCGGQPARERRHDHDVPRTGAHRERPRRGKHQNPWWPP